MKRTDQFARDEALVVAKPGTLKSRKGAGASAGRKSGGSGKTSSKSGGSQSGRRATVKVNYVKGRGATVNAKTSARYMLTRENALGEPGEREAFNRTEDGLERRQMYGAIGEEREDKLYYRIIISPETDREAEGVDMKAYVRDVMSDLEKEKGQMSWVAVNHAGEDGHNDHAHTHVIAVLDRPLDRNDLADLRESGGKHFQAHLDAQYELHAELKSELSFQRLANEIERDLDATIESDLYLDGASAEGTGLASEEGVREYYEVLKAHRPEYFDSDGALNRQAMTKALHQEMERTGGNQQEAVIRAGGTWTQTVQARLTQQQEQSTETKQHVVQSMSENMPKRSGGQSQDITEGRAQRKLQIDNDMSL